VENLKDWWRFAGEKLGLDKPVVPVVRLFGAITPQQKPGRINIQSAAPLLEKAFKVKQAPAVAIIINSPGGSPVQSRLVSNHIRHLADRYEKRALVFIEDVAASGGYFIAVGGDEIFADPSSIVGSIGVIYAGFGFEEAIAKVGVKRRIHTAGKSKSQLDPFVAEKKADIDRLKSFENDVHQVFIEHVKLHRGTRLKADDDVLFTGEWWTGVRSLDLGLIDELGDMHSVLRQRYGDEVKLKHLTPKKGLFSLPRLGFSGAGATDGLGAELVGALEDKALWSRFGL